MYQAFSLTTLYEIRKQLHKENAKTTNKGRLNNMRVKNQWISEEIKEGVRKYLETSENKHTSFQNLWDLAKAGLRGKLIAI